MNRIVRSLALGVLIFFAGALATAQSPLPRNKDQAIRELIQITGASNLGRQMMEQMRPALQKAIPDLPASFWDDFMAEVKTDEMTDLIVPIYARHFTLEELEELIAFNRTPLGQKVIAEMPAVMKESMSAGQEWGRQLGERAYRKAEAQRSKRKAER